MSEEEQLQTIPTEELPPLKFQASGDSEDEREANLQAVKPSPGYPHAVVLLADAITKRADLILMDFTANQVSVRYFVDGIWFAMPALTRRTGDYMLAALKQLAGLDYRERRARQVGHFRAEYLRKKHPCEITCQGVANGERVVIAVEREKPPTENLEDIGMRPGMRKQLLEILNTPGGMVLFSALPGDGSSTTWRAALQSTDRFTRDFVVIEDKRQQEPEIINVAQVTYDSAKGESFRDVIRGVMLKEPNVLGFAELPSGDALDQLSTLTNSNDLTTVTRLHARHAVEAVARALQLKPDVGLFARALQAVVGQRVIRMLCKTCRQPFTPSPKLLQQLGLPPDRVSVLYRAFQPSREEMVDKNGRPIELEPCKNCGGPGYYERTGIFELLRVDDRFRKAMQADQPTVQSLSKAASDSGHITLRDEGLVMVARGDTSLEELQRVLKK